jgi:hypothetical protein
MVEAIMPSGGGGGGDQDRRWRRVGGGRAGRVEWPRAVTAGERSPGGHILHRKTRGVKLNVTRIANGEPTNKKEIMGDVWGYENVVENEGSRENRGTN